MSMELLDSSMAQQSVIGSMLIDDRCINLVLNLLRAEDFVDGTCRATYRAIQKLRLEGKPVDPVTVVDAMSGGESYTRWVREVMEITPTAANVEAYADAVKRSAALYALRESADALLTCNDMDTAAALVRKMAGVLSATSRMPRMTAEELAQDFINRMRSTKKPEYLPWGIPAADRRVYAALGDMILLGGYPSAGKTLLSIMMALTQARRYKVGYYTLETQPGKMADRMFAHMAQVPMDRIKTRTFDKNDWNSFAEASAQFVRDCPIDFIRAAGSSLEDISADAISNGYQIIYIDYLQLIEVPGVRPSDRYAAVTAVSRGLKIFAQNHNIAVVALAQLSRPDKSGNGGKFVPPNMQSFRESGQIEQDADVAFLLWANDPADNDSTRTFKIAKNKEGAKTSVELDFDGTTQTMRELVPDHSRDVQAQLMAAGKAAKNHNRYGAQMQFTELTGYDPDNPFTAGGPHG